MLDRASRQGRWSRVRGKDLWAAVLSGVLAGLSQPLVIAPLSSHPIDPSGVSGALALVALVPLVIVLEGASPKRALLLGFLAAWVQIVIIAHWVVFAFEIVGVPIPLGVPIMLVVGAVLAAISALGAFSSALLRARLGWPVWVTFPAALTAAELFRNHIPFGGDPWGNLGMSMATIEALRQPASIVGVYGLVLFVAMVNVLFAEAARPRPTKTRLRFLGAASAMLLVWIAYGVLRAGSFPSSGSVRVAILQASIPQTMINDPKGRLEAMRAPYHRLQTEAIARGAQIVVWPETALLPPVPAEARDLSTYGVVPVATATMPPAAIVGAGVVFRRGDKTFVHNTAFALDGALAVRGRFDKLRLVPFGEMVPWPLSLILERMVTVEYELLPGEDVRPVAVPVGGSELRTGVTICWDGVFPEITRRFVERGAKVMFNLTNDAWYGVSSAPYQHLQMYVMRATESARGVARAANTGISALIDPRGKIHQSSELFVETLMIGDVALSEETTIYVVIGDAVPWLCVFFIAAAIVAAYRRPRRA
jgi:apolipoprotein N-acyltransferase